MAVSDHTTASRASQVYQLTNRHLRLMHTDPDIINLQDRRAAGGAAE